MRGSLLVKTFTAAAVTSVLFAPLAHADDARFIKALDQAGLGCGQGLIQCPGPTDLVATGKAVCYDIDKNHESVSGAIAKLPNIAAPGTNTQRGLVAGNPLLEFAVVAMDNYCPWNGHQLGG